MNELHLCNRQKRLSVDLRLFRQIARAAIADDRATSPDGPPGHYDLGIYFVTARAISKLNEKYLRHQGPTDVITFNYAERASAAAGQHRVHGDIFISADEAVAQAGAYRATWQAELVRYLVHGLLHLGNFDDKSPSARRVMKREEDRRLRKLARQFSFAQLARRAASHARRPRPSAIPRLESAA
ncbi:MAG: rRNA maturation RNase YbeY [Limisphaerales bacterium]